LNSARHPEAINAGSIQNNCRVEQVMRKRPLKCAFLIQIIITLTSGQLGDGAVTHFSRVSDSEVLLPDGWLRSWAVIVR
jgi:hypothetical protein